MGRVRQVCRGGRRGALGVRWGIIAAMPDLPSMARCSRCPRLVAASEVRVTGDGQRICAECESALQPGPLAEAEREFQHSLASSRRKLGGVMMFLGALIGAVGAFSGVRALSSIGVLLIVGGIVRILSANAK